jgi:hypothetical protein
VGDNSVLSSIRSKYLILEGENLEAFPSRSVIRVTTTHAKKNLITEAVEEAVKTIEKRKFALGDLYPASLGTPTASRLKTWARRHFDDEVLQELSRTSNSSISRKSKHKVCDIRFYRCRLTKSDSDILDWGGKHFRYRYSDPILVDGWGFLGQSSI